MGSSGGAIQDLKGKTCNIVIGPDGKIVDISEAGNLVYNVEEAESQYDADFK